MNLSGQNGPAGEQIFVHPETRLRRPGDRATRAIDGNNAIDGPARTHARPKHRRIAQPHRPGAKIRTRKGQGLPIR